MGAVITWTFTLEGVCVYCGKKCTRQRSFVAATEGEASKKADAVMADGLWHKRCGLC